MKGIIKGIIPWLVFLWAAPLWALSGQTYGSAITVEKETGIAAIAADPSKFVGQRVLIKGRVVDVCARRGCWMELAVDESSEKLKVKVDDGVIVFPMSAKGKEALVEGVVEEITFSRQEVVVYRQHEAEERGETFDPSTVTEGETFYRIKATGAVIPE